MADNSATADDAQGQPATTPFDTAGPATSSDPDHRTEARSRFNAAIDEAKAGLAALKADAAERGSSYKAMATGNTADWVEDAKAVGSQARKRAEDAANTGKAKASDGIAQLGKVLSDTASVVDEKLGAKYGDYARSAARSMQETAARIEAKELSEIGDDVREFVRKSPGAALGVAAVAGFFIARLLGIGGSKD